MVLYGFQVVPSLGSDGEPAKRFFARLQCEATQISDSLSEISNEDAMRLCEFLDAVDSRATNAPRNLYQACLSRLFDYLENAPPQEAKQLALKSWAADTCQSLCDNSFNEPELCRG